MAFFANGSPIGTDVEWNSINWTPSAGRLRADGRRRSQPGRDDDVRGGTITVTAPNVADGKHRRRCGISAQCAAAITVSGQRQR